MPPRAYYNEIDLSCAAWLYALIQENLIAPGDIDTRDIRDVKPSDLAGYTQCHFFAGIGGWSLALRRAHWPDHRPVWTGSCPCQPFSAAGKRGGFADERHLWPYFQHLIRVHRPPRIYGEQVASAAEWLRLVRGDLEALEYAVGAMPIEAASAGADHLRDRFWFVADDGFGRRAGSRGREGEQQRRAEAVGAGDSNSGVVNAARVGRREGWSEHEVRSGRDTAAGASSTIENGVGQADAMRDGARSGSADGDRSEEAPFGIDGCVSRTSPAARIHGEAHEWANGADGKARRVKPGVRLLVDGFPSRVGLLRGFGNAIDPRPAAAFIESTM